MQKWWDTHHFVSYFLIDLLFSRFEYMTLISVMMLYFDNHNNMKHNKLTLEQRRIIATLRFGKSPNS